MHSVAVAPTRSTPQYQPKGIINRFLAYIEGAVRERRIQADITKAVEKFFAESIRVYGTIAHLPRADFDGDERARETYEAYRDERVERVMAYLNLTYGFEGDDEVFYRVQFITLCDASWVWKQEEYKDQVRHQDAEKLAQEIGLLSSSVI